MGLKNLTKERTDFDKKARTCVCHDKTRRLSRQKHARRDKTFVATYICYYFVATNDVLSQQRLYLWQLLPMIEDLLADRFSQAVGD